MGAHLLVFQAKPLLLGSIVSKCMITECCILLLSVSCNVTCQKGPQMSWTVACTGDNLYKPGALQFLRPGSASRQVWGYPLASQLICPVPPPSPEDHCVSPHRLLHPQKT